MAISLLLLRCLLAFSALSVLLSGAGARGASAGPLPGNEAGYDPLWNLKVIGADRARALTAGSSEIIVGVIDTGLDTSHQQFAGRVVQGMNFAGTGDTNDKEGHGTFVAGIIAGATTGVAPNVRIMPLKVFDNAGRSSNLAIAEAIRWGVNQGVRIFNLSLGGITETDELSEAIRYAYSRGAILICAAGNSGQRGATTPISYPAASKGAFGVAATTWDDKAANYSSPGPWVKVSAPGGDVDGVMRDPMHAIYGAHPGNKMERYELNVGTSFAAPHVAGIAALIWSVNPSLTNTEVENLLMKTADRVWSGGGERTDQFGAGRVNALRAVLMAMPQDWQIDATGPASGASSVTVAGWAANLGSKYGPLIDEVRVFLDGPEGQGQSLGLARYGIDPTTLNLTPASVPTASPTCQNCGFTFTWDCAAIDAGPRTLFVGARTLAGDWLWRQVQVEITR